MASHVARVIVRGLWLETTIVRPRSLARQRGPQQAVQAAGIPPCRSVTTVPACVVVVGV